MTPAFCHNCGANLVALARVEDGPFAYDGRGVFTVNGERLDATLQAVEVAGSVMLAKGRAVAFETLAERIGYEGLDPRGYVKVLKSFAQKAFDRAGVACPLESVAGVGYRWSRKARRSPFDWRRMVGR